MMETKEFLYCCNRCGMVIEFEQPQSMPEGWHRIIEKMLFYDLCPKCSKELKND